MERWIAGEPTTYKTAIVSELRTDLSEVRDLAEVSPIEEDLERQIEQRLDNIGVRVTDLTKSGTLQDDSLLYDIHGGVHKIASSYSMGHLEPDQANKLHEELMGVPGATGNAGVAASETG